MHMAKVVVKLLNGDYADEGGVIADLRLMVENCRRCVCMFLHVCPSSARACMHLGVCCANDTRQHPPSLDQICQKLGLILPRRAWFEIRTASARTPLDEMFPTLPVSGLALACLGLH